MMQMYPRVGALSVSSKRSTSLDFSSTRTVTSISIRELRKESYGAELLHAIGFVYVSKAKHHLATSQTFFGVGGWLHNVQGKYHVFSET